MSAYTLGTADAVFLLSDDLNRYLRDVGKHAIVISTAQYAIEPLAGGSEQRMNLSRKIGEEITWFNGQSDELIAYFKPFLKLDEPKRRR